MSVRETLELVAVILERVRLLLLPLALMLLVVPLAPPSKTPKEMDEKSSEPLLAVTSTLEPSTSGPVTLVNVTLVAAVTSPWKARSSMFEN